MTWWLFKRFLFSKRSGALVRFISWLCVSGIGVGAFSLIVVMSVMNGFNESIRNRLFGFEPHLVVDFSGDQDEIRWNNWSAEWLKVNPGVEAESFERQDVIIKTVDGFFGGAQAIGKNKESLQKFIQNQKVNYFEANHREGARIFLGIGLANSLNIFEQDRLTLLPPESLLLPPGEAPKISQAIAEGFLSTQIPEIDQGVFYYDKQYGLGGLQKTASLQKGVELRIKEPLAYESFQKEIKAAGFSVSSWKERNSALFRALMLEKTMIIVFLAMSTLIASFSIITVLVLLSTQKQKEFGILMSLGLSTQATKRIFLKLGLWLSGLGLGGGLVLGTLVSLYIEKYPLDILPNIYYDSRIPADVDFRFIVWVSLGAVIVSFLASWYPSKKMAEVQPSEALRSQRKF